MHVSYFLTRWQVAGYSSVCGWVMWGRKTQAVCLTTWLGVRRTEVQQNNILTFYGSLSSSTYGSVKKLRLPIVVRIRQHILV